MSHLGSEGKKAARLLAVGRGRLLVELYSLEFDPS